MLGTDGRMKRAVHEYEYDSSGRLTEGSGKVERTTGGILRPNIVSYKSKYAYDTIGNILTKTQAVNGGESNLSCDDTYTYGGKQPHAVTKAGAMVFTYDDNGNMIKRENTETKNTMTLVWDDENRLIKTTDSFHTTDYRYEANGERIIKKSELGETQYVSANYIVRNKTVISKHVFAGNQRIASTVSMKNNCGTMTEQNTMYFHPDHLGSSSYVTDKKGNFFEMIEYLPYGETLYDEAATVDKTEFRFTSHLKDDETGFYYCHARYYDPMIGRFLSTDPAWDDLTLYAYCGNNPIMYSDPTGMLKKNEDGSVTFDKKTDKLADAAKEAGWGKEWDNAARVMGVENSFDKKGNWIKGSKSLLGKTLPKAYEETWTAAGTETYLESSQIVFPDGESYMRIDGYSTMMFSNGKQHGVQDYTIQVTNQIGIAMGSLGFVAMTTKAKGDFLAGSTLQEIFDSWEGDSFTDDATMIGLAFSTYSSDYWKDGKSWGATLQFGFPYSRTMSRVNYKKAEGSPRFIRPERKLRQK